MPLTWAIRLLKQEAPENRISTNNLFLGENKIAKAMRQKEK